MKKTIKKIVSLFMVIVLMFTMSQSVFAVEARKVVGADEKTELNIETDKKKYSWGDTITFNITVKNVSGEHLDYVNVKVTPRNFSKFLPNGNSTVTVYDLEAGESETIQIKFDATRLMGGLMRLLVPFLMLFSDFAMKTLYRETAFNYQEKVKVGGIRYKFGFEVTYDKPESDSSDNGVISFVKFASDTTDIHIDQIESVTFYATMMSEEIISDTVSLQSESDGIIGELKDDGVAPDKNANDGIFTGKFDLYSDTRSNEKYRAICQDIVSEPVDICFYKDLTNQDFYQFNKVLDKVEELANIDDITEYLSESSSIESFKKNQTNNSVTFTSVAGITGVWQADWSQNKGSAKQDKEIKSNAHIEETSNYIQTASVGTASNKNISVIRPFRSTQFTYDNFKDCANNITSKLGGTVTLRDDASATMSFMKTLDDYGIVMFDTHGTLADVTNSAWSLWSSEPYIILGEKMDSVTQTFFDADWQSSRIIVIADWRNIAIGAKFFDHYYTENSFDETVFFLGSCYSMINNSIASVLVEKGASVVFGYSDVVSVGYCNNTLDEIMWQSMTKKASTAKQGFDNAVNKHGAYDPYNQTTYLKIYGNGNYKIAVNNGKLSGVVKSYTTRQPICLAKIEIFDEDMNAVQIKYSDSSDGSFEIKLPEGKYTVQISAYGYLTRTVYDIEIASNNTTYMSESAMLYPDENPEMGGYVINTLTGEHVAGASIQFRKGHNQKSGAYVQYDNEIFTLISGSNGEYYTNNLPSGYYTAEVKCDGFIIAYIDVVAAAECTNQNLNITPTIAADQLRIVLTWGATPADLDSHLVGPNASGSGKFHTYFSEKEYSLNGIKYADLDRDDTNSYGPEQTTVYVKKSGTYSYYVHDYTNRSSSNSNQMAKSGAKVVVNMGDAIIATYYVPSNIDGTLWHVFDYDFDTGIITPVNAVSYKSDYKTIGS